MKTYTDIEQSKKLAEILPLESADMRFCFSHTLEGRITGHYPMIGNEPSLGTIPCWSLAALYAILPNNKNESTTLSRGGWKIDTPEYLDNWWCVYEDNGDWTKEFSVSADNPIDACYEMIIKLHELNMLSITHD